MVSLTRAAAAIAAGRDMPIRPDCVGTLHSFGYRSIGRPAVIGPKEIDAWNATTEGRRWHLSRDAVSGDLDDGDKVLGAERLTGTSADSALNEIDLLRHRMAPTISWSESYQALFAAWTRWKRAEGIVDFTDMIELSEEPPYRPAVILADEAQDLSALERACLERWRLATGAALILIGDGDQALYVWRGAAPQILYDPALPTTHVDVLAQSYRVPRAVHKLARSWIARLTNPHLEIDYRPRDHEGAVEQIDASLRNPAEAIGIAEKAANEGKTCLLIAQANYMANSLAYAIRERSLPYSNPWRKKNGLWNPLAPRKGTTVVDRIRALTSPVGDSWSHEQLHSWVEPIIAETSLLRGAKAEITSAAKTSPQSAVDEDEWRRWFRSDALIELLRAFDKGPASLVAWWYARLLAIKRATYQYPVSVYENLGIDGLTKPPRIHVGTIHSVKGAEADVVILFPDITNAAWQAAGAPEGRDSLTRTFYVGMTRARETLYLARPSSSLHEDLLTGAA